MSWNNITPAWMLNPDFQEAVDKYANDKITKQEAYEQIKSINEVPNRVKDNWNPNID